MEQFEGVLTLGAGHSLIVGHKPEKLDLNQFNKVWLDSAKDISVEAFGFFGGNLNYHTYYPDVTADDINPKDEDFIEPVYRLLSKCIVSQYYPTDFGYGDALKKSMPLLVGQTINCDHETDVGNGIGAIKSVYWQESHKVGDTIVPAGINGVLRIDAKSNPRIARGIMMEPPSVHSNSVTVRFKWEKSHKDLSDNDFYEKLGTFYKDGKLVKRNVVEIIAYTETSLVSHGADPFAKKVGKDGKIIGHPDIKTYSFSQAQVEKEENVGCQFFDYKKLPKGVEKEDVLYNTIYFNNENIRFNESKNNKNEENMEELLNALFAEGMLTLEEGQEVNKESAITVVKNLLGKVVTLEGEIAELKKTPPVTTPSEKEAQLTQQIEADKPYVTIGKTTLDSLRSEVTADYNKLQEEADPTILALLAGADHATLISLGKTYKTQLEEKYPLACKECGSKDVSRASSAGGQSTTSNVTDVDKDPLSTIRKRKLRSGN